MIGLIGKKLGMSRIYDENGLAVPITVIQAGPCPVLQVKREAGKDGYGAVQVGFEPRPERKVNLPMKGHFKRAGVEPLRIVREMRTDRVDEFEVGQAIDLSLFEEGESVDVTGISKGRGFAGPMKRHNSSRGPESHGSRYHRRPGSLGASADPSHVFKGKKAAGQMGAKRVTTQNLKVVRIDAAKNLLLVRGSVPGHDNGYVTIKKSVKGARKAARS